MLQTADQLQVTLIAAQPGFIFLQPKFFSQIARQRQPTLLIQLVIFAVVGRDHSQILPVRKILTRLLQELFRPSPDRKG